MAGKERDERGKDDACMDGPSSYQLTSGSHRTWSMDDGSLIRWFVCNCNSNCCSDDPPSGRPGPCMHLHCNAAPATGNSNGRGVPSLK